MLNEYGKYLDDGILSIHFLKGKDGWRCVDLTPEDFEHSLVKYYGSFTEVQLVYYQTLEEALFADLGTYKPKRIGHFSLCQKFRLYFKEETPSPEVKNRIETLMQIFKTMGYSLDYNMAGLFKPYCKEPYRRIGLQIVAGNLGFP